MNNSINFRISGLPLETFSALFQLSDEELKAHHARRCIADSKPGYPCRVSLSEAEPGETVLLLPYSHHPVDGPYRSSGPIFVRENATTPKLAVNELPDVVKHRLLSVRAYSIDSWMLASAVAEPSDLVRQIKEFLSNEKVAYLHLHNAKPGCFSCRVDRA